MDTNLQRRNWHYVLGRRIFPTVEWVISWMELLCNTYSKHNLSIKAFISCTRHVNRPYITHQLSVISAVRDLQWQNYSKQHQRYWTCQTCATTCGSEKTSCMLFTGPYGKDAPSKILNHSAQLFSPILCNQSTESHQWAITFFLQATSRVPRWWIGERPPDMAASCDIYK